MKNLKFVLLSFVLLNVFICGGCGKTVINCEADEIKLYKWKYSGEREIVSTLEFEEDNAVLTIKNGDEHCKINGLCVFGDKGFVIIDNSLKKEFPFKYTLSGTELNIEYNGDYISFKKNSSPTS